MKFHLKDFLEKNRIIPVTVFDSTDKALRTAELLLKYSFHVIEITLRTRGALESMKSIGKNFPEIAMGAGSVLSVDSLKEAYDCGIKFAVSPALDPDLAECSSSLGLPYIPGVATPTEMNNALKLGPCIKIFPASDLGGVNYIKSMSAPFAMKEFCLIPTGGINDANYLDYLHLDRVIACGMSYMTDRELVGNGEFREIERRMKKIAAGLGAL